MNYNTLQLSDPNMFAPVQNMTEEEAMEFAREQARSWRNLQLSLTDYIVSIPDHPEKEANIAYRQALRDWPLASDFPAAKPTL